MPHTLTPSYTFIPATYIYAFTAMPPICLKAKPIPEPAASSFSFPNPPVPLWHILQMMNHLLLMVPFTFIASSPCHQSSPLPLVKLNQVPCFTMPKMPLHFKPPLLKWGICSPSCLFLIYWAQGKDNPGRILHQAPLSSTSPSHTFPQPPETPQTHQYRFVARMC